jgi:sodium-coupled neutral amino acid transporter 11
MEAGGSATVGDVGATTTPTTTSSSSMDPLEMQPSPAPPQHGHHHGGPPRRQVSNITLPKKQSGVAGACSNLVNSIVGAGIIGIPFALKESGLMAGVVLLILVSYFTDKSLRMLVELASFSPRLKDYGVLTFEDLLSVSYIAVGGENERRTLRGLLLLLLFVCLCLTIFLFPPPPNKNPT